MNPNRYIVHWCPDQGPSSLEGVNHAQRGFATYKEAEAFRQDFLGRLHIPACIQHIELPSEEEDE